MPRSLATASAAVILAAAGALPAGCGSAGTKTPTSSEPPESSGADAAGAGSAGFQSSTSTYPASPSATVVAPASGGTEAQTTTRTAAAPAYVHEESPSGELASAVAEVRAHGYTPESTSDYHPNQTLRVLVGTSAPAREDGEQQAFFFIGNRYLGTDSSEPSGSLRVVSQGDTEVTLAYRLYRPGDPACCPGGGQAHVTFQLNDGALSPVQAIPPSSERR
jgi:LppP/LprE lipoprotein